MAPGSQRGFTYLAMLFAVAMVGVALSAAGVMWSTERQREREKELLFIGNQFRHAIADYYEHSPGTVKRYPRSLVDLLRDNRFLGIQRHLRQIYVDPMTGSDNWGLITAPEGGIMGVHSLSNARPVKQAGFSDRDADFERKETYSDWRFVYRMDRVSGIGTERK